MKNYKCPYCDATMHRDKLVKHIDHKHHEQVSEEMTASRIVFNIVNNKDHGTCVVCKRETSWNEAAGKYNRLCDDPKCREKLAKIAQENMIRVHGVTSQEMLNDAEHQEMMLAHRSISGKYRFRDGEYRTYTGTYEKKCLEFMDKVLEIPSKDIMTPGPKFAYMYKDKEHFWITDIYYIPHNLVIEVKDGGDNPNTRQMISYREKQLAKEQMITNLGTYNYLRLTNNNFGQLMEIMAILKAQAIDDSTDAKNAIIRINESANVGGVPPASPDDVYIVAYGYDERKHTLSGDIEGFAIAKDLIGGEIIKQSGASKLTMDTFDNFLENRHFNIYKYNGSKARYKKILEAYKKGSKVRNNFIYETLSGKKMYDKDQIDFDPIFEEVNINSIGFKERSLIGEVQNFKYNGALIPILKDSDIREAASRFDLNRVDILEGLPGYVLRNKETGAVSEFYDSISSIPISAEKAVLE